MKSVTQFNISYVIHMSLACHSHIIHMLIPMYSYAIRMSLVCHLYLLVRHLYVTHMYLHAIRMSIVFTRMSFVCHPYVPVCHSHVTHMYSYVIVCDSYLLLYIPYVTRMWLYHEPLVWLVLKHFIKFAFSLSIVFKFCFSFVEKIHFC